MANNRMLVGCKICGECCFIGKWYPGGTWYSNKPKENGDSMYKFFEDHAHYDDIQHDKDNYEETYEIVYESNKTLRYNQDEMGKTKPTYLPNV